MGTDAASSAPPVRPQNWSAERKHQALIETASMTEEERGLYCRKNGLYSRHLEEWKKTLMEALKSSSRGEEKKGDRKLKAEIKGLKSELYRKEKALAETTALLVLKKKAHLIWGDREDDT